MKVTRILRHVPWGTPLVVVLFLSSAPRKGGVTDAFVAPRPFGTKAASSTTTTLQYKATRQELEKRAGQCAIVEPKDKTVDVRHVQGTLSHRPEECCKYGIEVSDEALKDRLCKITKQRDRSLLFLERGAKIVADVFGGDGDDASQGVQQKEKLVILGAGWGAAALLQDIDTNKFDVTVISPRNYFLFTPMLAGASVGTVDARSITRPIREFNLKADYLEAAASSVDTEARVVTCHGVSADPKDSDEDSDIREIKVPYDRLVVAVGARINTFGIPGVEEHCLFLKQIDDALSVRRRIVNLFERANYPELTDAERKKLLTFVVIGAGPTGVEFASELRDFIEEDGPKYYPKLLKHVSLKVLEASPDILRPFDETLREKAVEAMTRKVTVESSRVDATLFPEDLTELLLNAKVEKVTKDAIYLGGDMGEIPYGLAVWAGGIGPLPITLNIIESIGGRQVEAQRIARGKIGVDPWLRAVNADGRVFAMGDCTCTQGQCLPSTAQVAAQEGEFLAHLLSTANLTTTYVDGLMMPPQRDAVRGIDLQESIASIATGDSEYVAPFQFLDLGILAYTGGLSALAQVKAPTENTLKVSGKLGFGLWRGVYFMKQASTRNRVLIALDWIKARWFGRDITEISV